MKKQQLLHLLSYITNRFWLIMTIYAVSLATAAFGFAWLEQKSFADSLWWAVVTSLTIGYGDITPQSHAGRMWGVAFGHFWIFLVIPMIVANLIMTLVEDKHLFSDEEQRELLTRVRNIEALLQQQATQQAITQHQVKISPPPPTSPSPPQGGVNSTDI
jgi:hypothetical protein